MAEAVVIAVVLVRFFLPLFILRYPLPAILGCLVVDAADQSIFQAVTDDPMPGYQTYDKALDVFYLAIAYISSMRNWLDPMAFAVARFLYLYRLVGVTLFELLDHRWLLFLFPNTFEYFFIAYEAIRTRWNPTQLSKRAILTMAAVIWIFIKLPQEWWIHIAQLDFTEFMSDYSFMWLILGAVIAIATWILWSYRERIPRPDWPFTVDVDRHLPPANYELTGHEKFFTTVLLEKAVLLALIAVIFAQVLPDVRLTNVELIVGVGALVVLNAGVSQWLRRRGRTWASSAQAFAAMFVVNTGIVVFYEIFSSERSTNTPSAATLFFVVLLSLLIALFDRYRATRAHPSQGRLQGA